jgi:DNA-3-methyladenine glycosylase I
MLCAREMEQTVRGKVSEGRNMPGTVRRGDDGKRRCWWGASTAEYVKYHDREWGFPVVDDDGLFERLCLEGFQSGLSWLTILRKRDRFRSAFARFHIGDVAAFDERDVQRLLTDEGIVRNRRKIEATVLNARAALALVDDHGSFAKFIWDFAPRKQRAPRSPADIPATTDESRQLARALKERGFRFVGPTTVYALMQACGLVNDHLVGCYVRAAVQSARKHERIPR